MASFIFPGLSLDGKKTIKYWLLLLCLSLGDGSGVRGSNIVATHGERGISWASGSGSVVAPPPPLLVCPLVQQHEEGGWEGKEEFDGGRILNNNRSERGENVTTSTTTSPNGAREEAQVAQASDGNHDDDELRVEELPGWIKSQICHETPVGESQLFCAWTLPSFQNDFGISIITTPETFDKVLALDLPILSTTKAKTPRREKHESGNSSSTTELKQQQQQQQQTPESALLPPYKTVPVPGKGLGMLSTRPIGTNEVYMTRTPAVMVDDLALQRLGISRLAELLVMAVDALPPQHRDEYLSLTTHDEDITDKGQRVYAIFDKNNFLTQWEGVGEFHSTFTQVSRLNHACRPNSDYVFDSTTLSHNIFAATEINAGEELTLTYHDPFQTYAHRQHSLLMHWGFRCTCALCTANAQTIQESDNRITQVQLLWSILDQYQSSSATPDDAQRLIQLYQEEGLHTRMVEAYYRAAVEYNGRGDAERARDFALKAVEAGKVMESGIRPFMENMRAMAGDPTAHWTWMFRVPK